LASIFANRIVSLPETVTITREQQQDVLKLKLAKRATIVRWMLSSSKQEAEWSGLYHISAE
jgi:hypothetical protein